MANHFRSSEGQDGMAFEQEPQFEAQLTPEVTADVAAAMPVDEPAFAQRAAAEVASPHVSEPADDAGQASFATTMNVPHVAEAAQGDPRPEAPQAAAAASQEAGSTDGFDASTEAGFTTAFAPIADNADTRSVNTGGTPVISFQGVSMVYPAQPNKPALDNVDVDVYAGEFVFLVGHSGSGKSTFLKLITRELKPTHGRVLVAGQDLTAMRNWKVPYLRRQIGCVFQDFKLLPDKTIFDNVAFALECIGKPRSVIKAQVPEVLRLVGLGEKMDVYPDQLSGGEQQRVSVARAMVNRPPLLVCDEPTGNLDPAISLGIMKLLERINRTGTTILMATHDREMVDSMRKRVIALEAGHVVRDQEKGGYGYYGSF